MSPPVREEACISIIQCRLRGAARAASAVVTREERRIDCLESRAMLAGTKRLLAEPGLNNNF
jgi:hypothetical protein